MQWCKSVGENGELQLIWKEPLVNMFDQPYCGKPSWILTITKDNTMDSTVKVRDCIKNKQVIMLQL